MPAPRKVPSGGADSRLDQLDAAGTAKFPDNFSSIQTYYWKARLAKRQAELYRQRASEEQLYVQLLSFISTVVEAIPRHKHFSRSDPKYAQLKKDAADAFPELERLRAGLKLKFELDRLTAEEGPATYRPRKLAGTVQLSAGNVPEIHWEASLVAAAPPPPAGAALGVPQPEGFDLLSGLSLGPAAAVASSAAASAALLPALQQPAFPELPELSTSIRLPAASQATLAKHALLPSTSFGGSSAAPRPERPQQPAAPQQPRPLYPELAELEPPPPPPPPPELPVPSPYGELQLGPQEVSVISAPRPTEPLPPDATCCAPAPGWQQEQAVVPAPPPPTNGGVQEVKRLQTIRDVHVSVALMDEFMRYAVSNTRRGIETCGILAGTLSADDAVFTISTLIVPKQTGTTDTVEMLNEEEIFEVQDSRALYPLGWIHTHPSQTCFLSSVDVHTHCGFQTMLDEAVAVVMAPKDPSKRVGIFRLSTPGGLKLVQKCPLRGFHPHPPTDSGQPVYELCGHVYLNPRAKYEVVDLR